ncbi:MAG: hypothetical protein QG550_2226 [Pseudomonadota bacterium]|nr:hypothetical protein [Pseudomonadota bacterium]
MRITTEDTEYTEVRRAGRRLDRIHCGLSP